MGFGGEMGKITDIYAREILDSRGNPTVEVDVVLETGVLGRPPFPQALPPGRRRPLNSETGRIVIKVKV